MFVGALHQTRRRKPATATMISREDRTSSFFNMAGIVAKSLNACKTSEPQLFGKPHRPRHWIVRVPFHLDKAHRPIKLDCTLHGRERVETDSSVAHGRSR